MVDIDVHTHLAPINAALLNRLGGVHWNAEGEALVLDGHRIGIKDLFHPERLLERMDLHGVRRALVSIPPPLYRQHLEETDALEWVRYVNRELLAIAEQTNGRLGALFYIPLEHPGLFNTLRSDCDASTFEGVALAAGGHSSIVYSKPEYDSLWKWLNDGDRFAFLHPGTCMDARLASFYLENLVGNPIETGIAASHLVMAGVPSRYPRIRFCLAHAGGIFSSLVGRIERGFDTARPGVDLSVERPLQAARRLFVDGISHSSEGLSLARAVFGKDHILYGSDWPFPMGLDAKF